MHPNIASATPRKTTAKLAALTLVVLLVHAGLLLGSSLSFAVSAPHGAGSLPAAVWSTRMVELAPQPTPQTGTPAAPAGLLNRPPASLARAAHPVAQGAPTQTAPRAPAPTPAPADNNAPATPAPLAELAPGNGSETTLDTAPSNAAPTPLASQSTNENSAQPSPSGYAPPANLAAVDENKRPAAGGSASPAVATSPPTTTPAAPSSPAPARPSAAKNIENFNFPAPIHLKYKISGEVKGFPYTVNGDLQWQQDGKNYTARLEVSHFLLGSRVQTSQGELGANGLEPLRFGDKARGPEVAAHFDRSKGKVIFSANTPDAPLQAGTQDQLSTFMQIASMVAAAPGSFPEGTVLPFESVGPRSVETWAFRIGPTEKLKLPGGEVSAIKFVREAVGDYGTRGEVWLAPSMGYMPVRIRLTEANGNFADQRWSETVVP